jgi:hypothetical protein
MPTSSKSHIANDDVTISLTRDEALQLLEILKRAEALANIINPKPSRRFLGGLLKKVAKAVGKIA